MVVLASIVFFAMRFFLILDHDILSLSIDGSRKLCSNSALKNSIELSMFLDNSCKSVIEFFFLLIDCMIALNLFLRMNKLCYHKLK